MSLDVRYHPESLAELRAEIGWYEERRSGLGDQFETQVDSVIDGILVWPESGAVWPGWNSIPVVRSLRVPGIPYRLIESPQCEGQG